MCNCEELCPGDISPEATQSETFSAALTNKLINWCRVILTRRFDRMLILSVTGLSRLNIGRGIAGILQYNKQTETDILLHVISRVSSSLHI